MSILYILGFLPIYAFSCAWIASDLGVGDDLDKGRVPWWKWVISVLWLPALLVTICLAPMALVYAIGREAGLELRLDTRGGMFHQR